MTIENFTAAELGAAKRMLRHLLKTDLCAFVEKAFGTVCPGEQFWPSWPFEAIAHALESVVEGKTKRLIILMPAATVPPHFGIVSWDPEPAQSGHKKSSVQNWHYQLQSWQCFSQ